MYLGMKDFQQLTLIKSHIVKNNIKTKIITCPTIRDKNGIALSSRNIKLNKKQIKIAIKIYKFLKTNKKEILVKHLNNKKSEIIENIKKLGVKKINYLECLNLKTFKEPQNINIKFNIFVAYYLGKVRLIDNL